MPRIMLQFVQTGAPLTHPINVL